MSASEQMGLAESIAVTGPAAERDVGILHAYFGSYARGLAPDALDLKQACQLERNKFSVAPSNQNLDERHATAASELSTLVANQLAKHQRWRELLALVMPLLDRIDVGYVLIKALRSPFALMSDVDFLVPLPNDVARIATELEQNGFTFYRFRILAHPLKIMAVPPGQGPKDPPSVDLYPDAMWIRKHVLDGTGVVARRRDGIVRGIQSPTPSPQDDLYLVATHAFARGDITLAELDHGARLLVETSLEWTPLLKNAAAFGSEDALYSYLRLLKRVSACAGDTAAVPAEVLDQLRRAPACRGLEAWLDRTEQELSLPVRFPLWLSTIRSGVFHLPPVSRRLTFVETIMDAATHAHTVGSHLLRRD